MTTQAALSVGGTIGFTVSNTSTALITTNPQMKKITWHNPGSVIIYVCQSLDLTGAAQTAGPNPGNWAIYPGAVLTLGGDGVAGSWLGAAASAGSNPITAALSQTL